jgi:hypothetical protein
MTGEVGTGKISLCTSRLSCRRPIIPVATQPPFLHVRMGGFYLAGPVTGGGKYEFYPGTTKHKAK